MTPTPAMTHTSLKLRPLPTPVSLTTGSVLVIVDAPDSYPCRRCLHDGLVGETMRLVSYDAFLGVSPYTGAGPIFVHENGCEQFERSEQSKELDEQSEGGGVPEQLRRRLLAVRAYDTAHFMVASELVEGSDLEETARQMFASAEVAYLHVHFARAGCFAVRIDPG
ncbi:MAG TPA: DUF1203 domain-containing protein [Acidimicrobiales bacterium]|nr:DUF1203 domain-containing protein [Acidimicrobiales bacterium]